MRRRRRFSAARLGSSSTEDSNASTGFEPDAFAIGRGGDSSGPVPCVARGTFGIGPVPCGTFGSGPVPCTLICGPAPWVASNGGAATTDAAASGGAGMSIGGTGTGPGGSVASSSSGSRVGTWPSGSISVGSIWIFGSSVAISGCARAFESSGCSLATADTGGPGGGSPARFSTFAGALQPSGLDGSSAMM